jgi:hypothetical protein
MASEIPPPPPGFTVKANGPAVPPPPPGFQVTPAPPPAAVAPRPYTRNPDDPYDDGIDPATLTDQQRWERAQHPPGSGPLPEDQRSLGEKFKAGVATSVMDLQMLGSKLYDKYVRPDWTLPIDELKAKQEADYQRGITGKFRDLDAYANDLAVQGLSLGHYSLADLNPQKAAHSESFREHNPLIPGALEAAGEIGNAMMGIHGMGYAHPVERPAGLAEAAAAPARNSFRPPSPAEGGTLPPGEGVASIPPYGEWGAQAPAQIRERAVRDNFIATPQSIIDRADLREQRLADQEAAARSDVRLPPGMLMSAPFQRIARTMEEMPLVGRGLREANESAYTDMAARREAIASKFGTASGAEGVGIVAKGAMDNTSDMLLQRDKADADAIAQSLGRSASARDIGQIADEAISRYRDKTISPDTIRAMSSADLQDLKGKPASASSSPLQLAAAYELAAREIPENMLKGRSKVDESRFMGGMENTRQVLLDLAKRNQTMFSKSEAGVDKPGIGEGLGEAKQISNAAYPIKGKAPVAEYVRSVLNTPITFNIQAMRGIRTHFGAMVRDLRPEDAGTIQAADLERIQQAQTADIINLLDRNSQEYATNPKKLYDVRYNGQDTKMTGQELAQRTQAAKQLYFEADAMTKANKERMETLKRFYGNDTTPDQIGRAILSDASSKASNLDRLSALKGALRPAEWKEIGAGVLRDMWRTPETDFAPAQFRKNWAQMPDETKQILFGNKIRALNDLANSGSAEQIATLQKAYGKLPNEAVAGRILADAKEGAPGNIARLRQLFDASTPEQIAEIRAGLFRMLGRVTGDATGVTAETGFNPATFARNWKDMSAEGRNMLFRDTAHRQALDDFARVAERIQRFSKQGNPSGSAYSYMSLTGALAPLGAAGEALGGHVGALASMGTEAAGMYALGKLLSSTAYANWLTRAVELSGKGGSPLSWRTHINTLARIASQMKDPEAKAVGLATAEAYRGWIAREATKAVGAGSASRDTASGKQPAAGKTATGRPSRNLPAISPSRPAPVSLGSARR